MRRGPVSPRMSVSTHRKRIPPMALMTPTMRTTLQAPRDSRSRVPGDRAGEQPPSTHRLDPDALGDYIDQLYRAAWAICGSRHDAEDLVQETFVNVLKRPRFIRDGNEIGYLMRALRNTHANGYRRAGRRPQSRELFEDDLPASYQNPGAAREIMEAIASAPPAFRDAVIAVDLVGMSYGEAARSLGTREPTLTTRLHRGRQHVARQLTIDP
jgi:RNA polymerase sigma-70 factor, ECF subfamily